ncbi:MAG: LPS assembly protein LptD [Terracidiphilus sp.]
MMLIAFLALSNLHLRGQTPTDAQSAPQPLPDDPSQEILPIAQPEPEAATGVPVRWSADRQTWMGDTATLYGVEEFHYRDYVLSADKVAYNRSTTELRADGHVRIAGGPDDILMNADRADMVLNIHIARFYNVNGTMGVRTGAHTIVYSTANPLYFSGRVLIQNGEGNYRVIDGTMTNCRLPKPDWQVISRAMTLENGKASTSNSVFKFLGVPLFWLPYLRHPVDQAGRESGFLIPVFPSNYSSVRGYTLGEQFYLVINRSMDMIVGSEYYSKRGFAPNGDFRYKGPGFDHLTVRWNALFDRGFEQRVGSTIGTPSDDGTGAHTAQPSLLLPGPIGLEYVNQGGVDIGALGRKDFSPQTYMVGNVEFLSSYVYRLVFDDNYSQAVSSQVSSVVGLTHQHNGFIPSVSLERFQTFAGATEGDEARIIHLPNLHYDVLDRPLSASPLYWGLSSSLTYLSRSEPQFHARNIGRIDFYPHLSLPINVGGWSVVPEAALRDTFYSGSQIAALSGNVDTPTISHAALNRSDLEAAIDVRPPAIERDFALSGWHRELRHVIEPEFTYRFLGGIGEQARDVLLIDTADIDTNTNEVGYSLTQRFYVRPTSVEACKPDEKLASGDCPEKPREWASWQLSQKFYIDPYFGGAITPNRRNVFDSTLDLTAIAFLTGPRNLTPITSRLRLEAIENLRLEWDLDFDPKTGRMDGDNLFAGYTWGRTTVGLGHAMLNAVHEVTGSSASTTLQSQQIQPFFSIGKQSGRGFNMAANGGYDFVQRSIQYAGAQAVYNWNCCGLTVGYRRFQLGTVGTTSRNETQYLYSFTLANFGNVGDIRRSNSVFRDSTLPPAY